MTFDQLVGKTLVSVEGKVGDDVMRFACADGASYRLYHAQDCCESVSIEDICGDLGDLIGSPIVRAEENSNSDSIKPSEESNDSFTWTFYRIETAKGLVVIRWIGLSNGYYSESVDFSEDK